MIGSFRLFIRCLFNLSFRKFLFIFFCCPVTASAQNYFQQEADFSIQVTLNDKLHELYAFESINYINNSPDTLRFLYFHLWPNAYSGNETGLARQLLRMNGKQILFKDSNLRGFIDSLDFKVNSIRVSWNLLPDTVDICRINLNQPLYPGDTIRISTPFHVKLPAGVTSRLGHTGESYQISQWFPKPAVYDRSGWHQMQYLDQGEFYSEFGNYDVEITLPSNYVVGATGNLQTETEKEWLDSLSITYGNDLKPDFKNKEFPLSSADYKTITFKGKNIHDFAWFADKRFHVITGKITLPFSSREVSTKVMFTGEQSYLWNSAIKYVNDAILYFSRLVGDYPYDSYTAVQSTLISGLGMEYPGITVIGLTEDSYDLDEVLAHEICHSWFYSSLGSDERRYPYMDEGITSTYTGWYMRERYPDKNLYEIYLNNKKLAKFFGIDKMPVSLMPELEWVIHARNNLEQPLDLPAPDFTPMNYSIMLYNKFTFGFNYLRAYLGDSIFDGAIMEYYCVWKNKHPSPGDLENAFKSYSGKNLDWFFHDFIGTTKRLDYKIIRENNGKLFVKNNAELKSPLIIEGFRNDSVVFREWTDGFEGRKWIDIPDDGYDEIKIDPFHVTPELYRLNNNIRSSGILKKADPLRTKFYYTLEDPDKRLLIYIPLINWNREDGFMAGIALNNGVLLPKPVEYSVMPFVSFRNPEIEGSGNISFSFIPWNSVIKKTVFAVNGAKFGSPGNQNYRRAALSADVYFRDVNNRQEAGHQVFGTFTIASDLTQVERGERADMKTYFMFGYRFEKTGILYPLSINSFIEFNNLFQKTSFEFNYKYNYYGKKNGLDIRVFTGIMLKNNPDYPFYNLSPAGRSGRELYLFQGSYPDRFTDFPETFWSRQMTISEGALVSHVNDTLGYSKWLLSVTLTSSLPGPFGRLPLKPFVNLLIDDNKPGSVQSSPFYYEAGLKAGIWHLFEVYIPICVSPGINMNGPFKNRIRFVLDLNSILKVRLK